MLLRPPYVLTMNVPAVLKSLLIATRWNQARLAERLGVSQADISRYIRGREPRGSTMEAIRSLAIQHGVLDEAEPTPPQRIPVMGLVGAGGTVEPDYEQVPEDGIEQIELPRTATIGTALVSDPIGFRVAGGSMAPRFNEGDVLIVERDQPWAIESMIGQEAVVVVDDEDGGSQRLVKRIMPSWKRYTYNLESLDPQFPTIEGVRIRWASPVRVILPNIGLRKVAPPRRKPTARATAGKTR